MTPRQAVRNTGVTRESGGQTRNSSKSVVSRQVKRRQRDAWVGMWGVGDGFRMNVIAYLTDGCARKRLRVFGPAIPTVVLGIRS